MRLFTGFIIIKLKQICIPFLVTSMFWGLFICIHITDVLLYLFRIQHIITFRQYVMRNNKYLLVNVCKICATLWLCECKKYKINLFNKNLWSNVNYLLQQLEKLNWIFWYVRKLLLWSHNLYVECFAIKHIYCHFHFQEL